MHAWKHPDLPDAWCLSKHEAINTGLCLFWLAIWLKTLVVTIMLTDVKRLLAWKRSLAWWFWMSAMPWAGIAGPSESLWSQAAEFSPFSPTSSCSSNLAALCDDLFQMYSAFFHRWVWSWPFAVNLAFYVLRNSVTTIKLLHKVLCWSLI